MHMCGAAGGFPHHRGHSGPLGSVESQKGGSRPEQKGGSGWNKSGAGSKGKEGPFFHKSLYIGPLVTTIS